MVKEYGKEMHDAAESAREATDFRETFLKEEEGA